MDLVAQRQGFDDWLLGTFAQPDLTAEAARHYIWRSNDKSLKAFILNTISRSECKLVSKLPTASEVWNALRTRHEKRGPFAQLMLIKRGLDVRFTLGTPFTETITTIDDYITRISNMGEFDWPKFKSVMLINALGGDLEYLQSQIHGMADDPGFSSATIIHRIIREQDLLKHRAVQGEGPSALISQTKKRERTICSHCQRPGHSADFCIAPGGKFVGHTLEEARAAQRAAWAKERAQSGNNTKTSTANVAITNTQSASRAPSPTPSTMTTTSMTINGITWVPLPQTTESAQIALSPIVDPHFEFSAYEAHHQEGATLRTSINWDDFSYPSNVSDITSAYPTLPVHKMPNNSPFVLDSGASCHISPERGDFTTLTATAPHPISGFGGSCVYAVGIGTVDLTTKNNTRITLNRVLFVPNSTVRLISVYSINNDGYHTCYFDADSCNITDRSGNVVLTGTAWKQRRLYILDCDANKQPALNTADTALYADRTPDVETWHRRLGHCNHRTVIDMARENTAKGMPIDLSSAPATCDHCVLGKQTRSHVPKVREGPRATKRLERVYVDLCGPMPAVSKFGHVYSMNIMDDFSSYVWSIPLARKSEALNALRAWHRAVENQTGEKLKIVVTDNGELVSNTMAAWCQLSGIDHQLTAPYTCCKSVF